MLTQISPEIVTRWPTNLVPRICLSQLYVRMYMHDYSQSTNSGFNERFESLISLKCIKLPSDSSRRD